MNAQALVQLERAPRARWATPDAAIREAVMFSPLRGRGIDYARVPTTSDGAAVALDAISRVLAALGRFDDRTQQILVGWAEMKSYREIARELKCSDRTVRRLHGPAWVRLCSRLQELGLVEE